MTITIDRIEAEVDAYMARNDFEIERYAYQAIIDGLEADNSAIRKEDTETKNAYMGFGPIDNQVPADVALDDQFKSYLKARIAKRLNLIIEDMAEIDELELKVWPDGGNKCSTHAMILLAELD